MSTAPRFHPTPSRVLRAVPTLGIGLIGYDFMGRAHTTAYQSIQTAFWPPPALPRLVAICGRTEERVAAAAERYGFEGYYTDWHDLVDDPRVAIVDNCAWHNVHAGPCIAAAAAGKHVLCEKPLALSADEARRMRDAAMNSGITHMVAFNYRFAPAVRLAREILEREVLGRIHHVRFSYLQDHQADGAKPYPWENRPSGVLAGLGSHVVDLARFLIGEPRSVSGYVRTFNRHRPAADDPQRWIDVEDDDLALAQVEFEDGTLGTLEAGWICAGRKNQLTFSIHGAHGSLAWDLEDLNRLQVYLDDGGRLPDVQGFENVLVTESNHPYQRAWWPTGHILGWQHLHANLIGHFLQAAASNTPVDPWGATFEDGYRAVVVGEALLEASRNGRRVEVSY